MWFFSVFIDSTGYIFFWCSPELSKKILSICQVPAFIESSWKLWRSAQLKIHFLFYMHISRGTMAVRTIALCLKVKIVNKCKCIWSSSWYHQHQLGENKPSVIIPRVSSTHLSSKMEIICWHWIISAIVPSSAQICTLKDDSHSVEYTLYTASSIW